MKTLLLVLLLAAAAPARAELILYCTRCDPGNSKDASGGQRVLCYDCSTDDPPGEPIITCGRCDLRGGRVPGCDQCTITWPAP